MADSEDDLDPTPTRFSLYPVDRVAWGHRHVGIDDEVFDPSLFPFRVTDEVYFEDVSALIPDDEFDIHKAGLGTHAVESLERIKYALIHRFPQYERDAATGRLKFGTELVEYSRSLIRETAACLRLIRPTSQRTQFCEGEVSTDGKLYNVAFDNPMEFVDAPANQKQFSVRIRDAEALRTYAPLFRTAMAGPYWKFRMAVQMHEAGHFQNTNWKARFFLWTSALESLYTSQNRQNSGSLVAKERIKALLGTATPIFPVGDLSSFVPDPGLTVADVVDELYCLRNHIAHGDKIPDYYFEAEGRPDFDGASNFTRAETLIEAISFLVRQSLLTILRDGLLTHFQDAASSEAYFAVRGLTKSQLAKCPRYQCPV